MANLIKHYRTLTAGQALPAPSADLVGTLAMQAHENDRLLWFCVGTPGNEQWVAVATDIWQPYAEGDALQAIAATGLSYTAGQGVQIIDMGPPPGNPADARFDDWNQYVVADIDAAAAYALPTSDTARILDTSASFRIDPYVAQEGVAKLVEIADLTAIGTVNWDIDKLIYEGNIDSDTDNFNQRFEIWGDLAGVPDPANVLVAVAGIDHSGMAGGTGNAPFDLNLTTPLSVTSLDKLWIVCLRLNAPADFRAASLWNWGDRPADQSDTGTYVKTPVVNTAVRVTADDGVTWGASANDPGLRVRVNMVRTSANQPPSSVYGVAIEAIDDTTVGAVILQGGLIMDASGAPFGETWNNNDLIYADVAGGGALTNIPPADPLDHIVMGSVLDNSAVGGALYVSAATTGTRGIFMPVSVYDPQGEYKDVFNLNNIDRGTLDASRVNVDDTTFTAISGTDAQTVFDSIDDALAAGGGDLVSDPAPTENVVTPDADHPAMRFVRFDATSVANVIEFHDDLGNVAGGITVTGTQAGGDLSAVFDAGTY